MRALVRPQKTLTDTQLRFNYSRVGISAIIADAKTDAPVTHGRYPPHFPSSLLWSDMHHVISLPARYDRLRSQPA
jgi:hypothetical protein